MTINKYFEYLFLGFRNYFKFKGRTTREEFWCFYSFILLVNNLVLFFTPLYIFGICMLIFFVPVISIFCRRLHDMNKSGWIQCLYFLTIGLIGALQKIEPIFFFIVNILVFISWVFYLSQKTFKGKTKYEEK
jgi:uncharacterized membrane protein YhaH (DUF805 family)